MWSALDCKGRQRQMCMHPSLVVAARREERFSLESEPLLMACICCSYLPRRLVLYSPL